MDFCKYQELALKTEQATAVPGAEVIVALLGLASEAGELLGEYKKYLRDGAAHRLFQERVAEELGDLLWYIANVARKFDLDLNFIAERNLEKCRNLWAEKETEPTGVKNMGNSFDSDFPEHERLPRKFEVEITEVFQDNSIKMKAFVNGQQIGNDLTDNSYANDGYRFHDVFHLAYAGVLGWSPVTRQLLGGCKRKSNLKVDEVEDGGRAKAIEEGISALVFSYAKNHAFLEGVSAIDYHLLRTIKEMTSHLEVAQCSLRDWAKAILMGYEIWRQVDKNRGGIVVVDLDARSITYQASYSSP
ncbi:nucleoside triphosphate pyrophosphohydrolase family protein [Coleofasciculus sp. FACHB-SPT36]|uniref:nucleoside triphosphate pyrophosphohydrolase family protein n=1 Tax=Cyanophyceae TaxID=3028117 RepID=UPI00168AB458|nr:nucleoside triphosphate pyrophosphohydrolase family protein [Coleofasciculus sp. FACHB-SPT36]MBD2538650.1 nucleoside triphosphate pyrophosphohydrolase family protein [Coleofasciculus sp. FACHB-SPT36]